MINLSAIKWQLVSGVTGLALLVALGNVVAGRIEIRHLRKVVASLTTEIRTVRADLATETANRATLEASIERQNAEWQRESAAGAARLAQTQQQLAAQQARARNAETRAKALLGTPARGDTLLARIIDVDNRVLESLE